MARVIVFGPSGGVGSAVALTAAERGAHVSLAMRDPRKSLPSLSEWESAHGSFSRIQADLTDAASISKAIETTGATRAFIYLAHGSEDFMRSALEALKSAGIEFIVFLSTRDVPEEPSEARPEDVTAFLHGNVEVGLREIFGAGNYAAVRPGAFATNLLQYKSGIEAGEVGIYGPEMIQDHVSPSDIGIVAGAILAKGLIATKSEIWVFGPHCARTDDVVQRLAKAMGKTIKIKPLSAEESIEQNVHHGVPRPIAEYIARATRDAVRTGTFVGSEFYEEGVKNVELYKGSPGQGIDEWIQQNSR